MHTNTELPLKKLFANLSRYRKLWYLHEMEVDEFFIYRLWRDDLRTGRYKSFIGWRKHIKSLIALNPVQYRCITENKHIFYAYCRLHNFPTSEIFAIYDPNYSGGNGLRVLRSISETKAFLSLKGISECVLKPEEGTRGRGVLALRYSDEDKAFYSVYGNRIYDEHLEERLRCYDYRGVSQSSFLLQRRLHPHPSTMQLSNKVPFSYRVLTILKKKGPAEIIEVYAKCPVGEKDTDNWENGGLVIRLNAQGICQGANDKGFYRFDVMQRHPENGFVLKGWKAPFYKEACALGLKLAECFSFARCVAWDIIVAEDGIYVIEGNNPWSVAQQETYDQGLWQNAFAEEATNAIILGPKKSPWWQ